MGAARDLTLPDGSRVLVRPIEPGDQASLTDGFQRLGTESRHRRFLSPLNRLDGAALRYLTEIDHRDHEALIAFDAGSGESVGVARFVRGEDRSRAEAAVVVVDDWQGRGLGTVLLERLAERAREESVEAFRALVLASNRQVRALLERIGEVREVGRDGELVELEVQLGSGDQTGS